VCVIITPVQTTADGGWMEGKVTGGAVSSTIMPKKNVYPYDFTEFQ
jgi:hypothetical protein